MRPKAQIKSLRGGLFRSLVVISCLGSVLVSQGVRGQEVSDYWPQTSLKFDKALKMVNNLSCYNSLKLFLGCVEGVNSLAKKMQPSTELKVTRKMKPSEVSIVDYDPVSLVEIKENEFSDLSALEIWNRQLTARENSRKSFTALYNAIHEGTGEAVDFYKVLQEVRQRIGTPEKEAELAAAVINGYLKTAFDAHSYVTPSAYIDQLFNSSGQSYFGVGMHLMEVGSYIALKPIDGFPAGEAGIQNGDVLTHVNGESIAGFDSSDVANLVKGPEGTEVRLGILRDKKPMEVVVVRKKVTMENVTSKIVNDTGMPIGYIKIRNFMSKNLCEDVRQSILELESQGARGLVLDLRGNGGGLLVEAVCATGLFVGPDKVVVQVGKPDRGIEYAHRSSGEKVTDLPLVTLIDAMSASASEIMSGALQDYQRSWVLGERSYGKGSVQAPAAFLKDASVEIFVTIQLFYQPKGRTNQLSGIHPDFIVPLKPNATEEERFALREAERYPNAIGGDNKEWVQPRSEEVQILDACMKKEGVAERLYVDEAPWLDQDYQLVKAQDLLNCAL